jgi:hypothetical protein
MDWRVVGVGLVFFVGAGGGVRAKLLSEADLDVTIVNDGPVAALYGAAAGDFDGDGRDELAVLTNDTTHLAVALFPGGERSDRWLLSAARRIRLTPPAVKFNPPRNPVVTFADWNGDGRDDLFIAVPERREVDVLWGRSEPFHVLDITSVAPDRRITGVESVHVVGDYNGDGVADVLFGDGAADRPGRSNAGAGYLFFGAPSLPGGVVSGTDADVTFWGASTSTQLTGWGAQPPVRVDVNGDGIDDLIASHTLAATAVWFGRPVWPSQWDLATRAADRTVVVNILFGRLWPVGDFARNGRGDFVLANSTMGLGLLDGATVMATGGTLTTSSVDPSLRFGAGRMHYGVVDFDGDGKPDLVQGEPANMAYRLCFLLSRDWAEGVSLGSPTLSSTMINRPLLAGGDFNGDGFDDVVLGEGDLSTLTNADWTGRIQILYGHVPLTRPSLTLSPPGEGSRWGRATLSVDGAPSEMKLSGDVAASENGRWVPFEARHWVELTGGGGTKIVRAVFRNALRKESDEVSAVTAMEVGERVEVQTVRNRIADGGPGRWDVSLPTGGRLRATVNGPAGTLVRELVDEVYPPGVWPVSWDGRNAGGARVSPGQYRIFIDAVGVQRTMDAIAE